jgi:hypothetical protein
MLAGGEFIIRCLGLSRFIVPIAGASDVREMIFQKLNDMTDYNRIYEIITSYAPSGKAHDGSDWHKNFLNSANWLDTDKLFLDETSGRKIYGRSSWFSTTLWTDAHFASHEFYDRFWRVPACEISWKNLGLVIKTHVPSEVSGLKYLIPQAKIWCLDGYDEWKDWCEKNKVTHDNLQVWKSYEKYTPIPDSYVFQVDDLIWSEKSFINQMEKAYDYFNLIDFNDVKEHIINLRLDYLKWNSNFGNTVLENTI